MLWPSVLRTCRNLVEDIVVNTHMLNCDRGVWEILVFCLSPSSLSPQVELIMTPSATRRGRQTCTIGTLVGIHDISCWVRAQIELINWLGNPTCLVLCLDHLMIYIDKAREKWCFRYLIVVGEGLLLEGGPSRSESWQFLDFRNMEDNCALTLHLHAIYGWSH